MHLITFISINTIKASFDFGMVPWTNISLINSIKLYMAIVHKKKLVQKDNDYYKLIVIKIRCPNLVD